MKKTFIAGLVLGAAAQVTLAQEPKTEARTPKIAVIDMARVSAESLMGKGYASQLEALQSEINSEGTKKQSELQKLDAAIKTLQDELEKQASVLSPEAAEKKRQDIVKRGRERQAFLEDGQADLQRMREAAQQRAQALNSEFQAKIKPHRSEEHTSELQSHVNLVCRLLLEKKKKKKKTKKKLKKIKNIKLCNEK